MLRRANGVQLASLRVAVAPEGLGMRSGARVSAVLRRSIRIPNARVRVEVRSEYEPRLARCRARVVGAVVAGTLPPEGPFLDA